MGKKRGEGEGWVVIFDIDLMLVLLLGSLDSGDIVVWLFISVYRYLLLLLYRIGNCLGF